MKPVSAFHDHPWESGSHARNVGGVELQHHPRYPQSDDDADQFPRLEVPAQSDLDAAQDNYDQGQAKPEIVSEGENLSSRRLDQTVDGNINKRLEIPQFFG